MNKTKLRIIGAWFVLGACIVAWPVTALTVFKEEPQGILGLSYIALILTSIDILSTQDVRDKQ